MDIKAQKVNDTLVVFMQGGWVSKFVVDRVKQVLAIPSWNCEVTADISNPVQTLGNEVKLTLANPSGVTESGFEEMVEYLNIFLKGHIGSGFTTIGVDPYKLPDYDNAGGLTVLSEISKETSCPMDPGSWGTAVTFKPEDNVTYNKVIELLKEFNMTYHNFLPK